MKSHLMTTTDKDKHDEEGHKPWGLLVRFTLLVYLATLSGVLFFIQLLCRSVFWNDVLPDPTSPSHHPDKKEGDGDVVDIAIPSFASGALLATYVFLRSVSHPAIHHRDC